MAGLSQAVWERYWQRKGLYGREVVRQAKRSKAIADNMRRGKV